jgi:hypothetical protein
MSPTSIDLEAIGRSAKASEPYPHFTGSGFLREDAIDEIERSFPKLESAGFLTLDEAPPEGAFAAFLEELQSPELSQAVSEALGFDLTALPQLVTVMRICPRRAGRIHTDGRSKLATFLVYFNREWPAGPAGSVRVLRGPDNFDDMAAELPPLMGNIFGFLRSDASWHGHLPYEGERRVLQLTWLASEADVARKKHNNAFAQGLKSFWPRRRSARRAA